MKKGNIYIIHNNVNSKLYVGQTWRDPHWYFRVELSRTKRKERPKLCNAINKHGFDKFWIEVIDSAETQSKLDTLEIHYIKKYDAIKNGYNCAVGGSGNGPLSDETKLKISKSKRGIPNMKNRKEFSNKDKELIKRLYTEENLSMTKIG